MNHHHKLMMANINCKLNNLKMELEKRHLLLVMLLQVEQYLVLILDLEKILAEIIILLNKLIVNSDNCFT